MYNISDNDLLHQQTIISDRYEIKKKKNVFLRSQKPALNIKK